MQNPNKLLDPNRVIKKKCPVCNKKQLVKTTNGMECGNCNYINKKEIQFGNAKDLENNKE